MYIRRHECIVVLEVNINRYWEVSKLFPFHSKKEKKKRKMDKQVSINDFD